MKKIIALLLVLFFAGSTAMNAELKIKPDQPKDKDKIQFTYSPVERFTTGENLYLSVFTFAYNSTNPTAHELAMRYDPTGRKYTSEFTLPAGTVYAIVQLSNGKLYDNNNGNFWDVLVYGPDGKPVKGAYLKNSVTFLGNLPISANREANFMNAVELLKKEIEIYPDNIQADIGLTSFKYDLKMINKNDFEAKMNSLIKARINTDDENDVKAMSRALKIMNSKDKADKMEADYAAKFPQSSLAEELAMAALAKATSRQQFNDLVVGFFNNFPNSSSKDRVFSGLIDSYMQSGDYNSLMETLSGIKRISSGAYIKLAFTLSDNKKALADSGYDYKMAEVIRLLGLAKDEALKENYPDKPIYITDSEWKRQHQQGLAVVSESFARVYMAKKDYPPAIKHLNEALTIYADDSPSSVYESLVQAYYETADYRNAYDVSVNSILKSKSTDAIDKLFPFLYKKLNGEEADYSAMFDSLLVIAKDKRIEKLRKNMLNMKVDLSMIETLNGIKIDLNFIKGKVIIIEFWSTWCGPCSDVLTSLESIYNMYSDNSDLLIAAVNIWEKGTDRKTDVQEYLNKGEFDLPVYLDLKDELPKKLSVSGLPTRYYIDKEGVVQFKEVGFTGIDESVRNASDIIELLLKKK